MACNSKRGTICVLICGILDCEKKSCAAARNIVTISDIYMQQP